MRQVLPLFSHSTCIYIWEQNKLHGIASLTDLILRMPRHIPRTLEMHWEKYRENTTTTRIHWDPLIENILIIGLLLSSILHTSVNSITNYFNNYCHVCRYSKNMLTNTYLHGNTNKRSCLFEINGCGYEIPILKLIWSFEPLMIYFHCVRWNYVINFTHNGFSSIYTSSATYHFCLRKEE